ncbi:TPA: hypothetical protein ACVEY8_001783 [Yersinia enterocolitica]|uniref:hypothetical protein n=1 Tax=Yersinia enterocolitica TaxID=630 RepID=UPI001C8F1985|nr:hypothetical protein [Yersinia enterocolitica]MBX9496619.1 hypothetical protein [Yersinia enterocolitica]HDV7160147.1 hypothetical protein [Yersinia enterocolitica]HEB9655359.1 hypothetical protein [Yersinia enterocolitica]
MRAHTLLVSIIAVLLSGCSSQAARMADCEAKGVSRDICYLAEQNRINTLNAAAEAQALRNASQAAQFAQAAKKKVQHYAGYGVDVKQDSLGIVTVDGKPAALIEDEPKAKVYSQGLLTVIFYTSGKVALLRENQFVGYLKKA